MRAYGGDIYKKRADVLRHFKKDAANVAIAWSNYSEQQIDRYKNAATRMEFGIGIKEDEQTQLLAHHRAISEPLPKDMNSVWSGDRAEVLSLVGVEEAADVGNDRGMTDSEVVQIQSLVSVNSRSIDTSQSESCGSENSGSIDTCERESCGFGNRRSIATSPSLEEQSPSHLPKSFAADIPTDADGLAENPDAYQIWQPKKMEGEVMLAEEWQERWAKLRERLKSKNIKKDK